MPPPSEATLAAIQADFLLRSDLARLLALNAALETPRMGEHGEDCAFAVAASDRRIARAIASSEQAARLLRETIGGCMLPVKAP